MANRTYLLIPGYQIVIEIRIEIAYALYTPHGRLASLRPLL